jgi:hypothetical protein
MSSRSDACVVRFGRGSMDTSFAPGLRAYNADHSATVAVA